MSKCNSDPFWTEANSPLSPVLVPTKIIVHLKYIETVKETPDKNDLD